MLLELHFRSKELQKNTQVNVLLPDAAKKPFKTLWLLHGLSGDHTDWMRYSAIERYAKQYDLAVIMPNADRSWYTDTAYGQNHFSYIANELPELCRRTLCGLSARREDNIVAGLSMGGYGAMKLALTHPERYGACISLSGSLDVTRKGRPCNLAEWQSIFGYAMQSPLELEGSAQDLFALAARPEVVASPPAIYMWCGTEDSLLPVNRLFDAHLTALGIPHEFRASEGDHTWRWWDLHVQNALAWLFAH